jgi:hypothetical protein
MRLPIGSLLAGRRAELGIVPLWYEGIATVRGSASLLDTGSRMHATIYGVVNSLPTLGPADEVAQSFAGGTIQKDRARAMAAWSRRAP